MTDVPDCKAWKLSLAGFYLGRLLLFSAALWLIPAEALEPP